MSNLKVIVGVNLACWVLFTCVLMTCHHPQGPAPPVPAASSPSPAGLPRNVPCPTTKSQAQLKAAPEVALPGLVVPVAPVLSPPSSSASAFGKVIFSPNHPNPSTDPLPLIIHDLKRQYQFLSTVREEDNKRAPKNALRDLTLGDSTLNFIGGGDESPASFHLILYPPNEVRCRATRQRQENEPPVSCTEFKKDTCEIFRKYFSEGEDSAGLLWKPRGQRSLTFLESGGLDGTPESSMTELMERAGWEGLVVEATPANYVQVAANRPCVSSIESAASPKFEPVQFFGWGGCCSGMSEAMSDKFVKTFHGKSSRNEIFSYNVRSAPISEIIAAWGKSVIDFWVLDVEGAEKFVLLGMDFQATGKKRFSNFHKSTKACTQ